ncbi:unnamed protein product [Meganyctiphanes norvegica]|uniref:Uncharacterized protein n=1 Tax=Meganyctiphanes norvegica TaxID=48144 RepID=A0AAV2RCL7_MEGNR
MGEDGITDLLLGIASNAVRNYVIDVVDQNVEKARSFGLDDDSNISYTFSKDLFDAYGYAGIGVTFLGLLFLIMWDQMDDTSETASISDEDILVYQAIGLAAYDTVVAEIEAANATPVTATVEVAAPAVAATGATYGGTQTRKTYNILNSIQGAKNKYQKTHGFQQQYFSK